MSERVEVTYDNGNVFGHFGRTEQFKVYDIEDGKVVNSEVVGTLAASGEANCSHHDEAHGEGHSCHGHGHGNCHQ